MILHETTHPLAISKHLLTPPPKPLPPPPPERGILVGYDGNHPLIIPMKVWQSTHRHLIGRSGLGKSILLYLLAIQELDEHRGMCVIDPHGPLYWMLLADLARRNVNPEDVMLIDPSWERVTTKMSPLPASAALAVDAIMRTAGERDLQSTMLFGKYVTALALAFEEGGYPVGAMRDFCMTDGEGQDFRDRVLSKVRDPHILREWLAFNRMSDRDKRLELSSLQNRLWPFMRDLRVRRSMSFPKGNVDWAEVMDSKKIVLANLSPGRGKPLDTQSRDLVGTLIMLGIREGAFRRKTDHPFSVFCDEFGSFVNDDFADNLDELRKTGVYLTLSHQRMMQIECVSKNVMSSVLTNCQIKLAMGMCSSDAKVMCDEMYTGEIHGEEVKYESSAVAFRPVLTREQVRSVSEGHTTASGEGSANVTGLGSSGGKTFVPDGIIPILDEGWTIHHSSGDSTHSASSETYFSSEAFSHAESVSDVPFYYFEEFNQEANRTYVGLDEQREKRIALLMNQPRQSVAVKLPGEVVKLVRTVTVVEKPSVDLNAYASKVWDACPYTVSNVHPVSVTSVDPPAAPRSVEKEVKPRAADPVRVGLEPGLAPPGQDSSWPDTSEPAADRSPSAPPLGKRPRGRPRKHPLPEPPGSLQSVETPPSDDLAPASDSDLL